jgi:hypothetical protein
VVCSHGWPLSADGFEDQTLYLASRGYRRIAHDRVGHGQSSQPWTGNEMETYADDLAGLVLGRARAPAGLRLGVGLAVPESDVIEARSDT